MVIGIDLGTSGVKVALLDAHGQFRQRPARRCR